MTIRISKKELLRLIKEKGFKVETFDMLDSVVVDGITHNIKLDAVRFTTDNKVWFTFAQFDNDGVFAFKGRNNVWGGTKQVTWNKFSTALELLELN